jgi:outer membrane protein OmpA-like peptidoglycan-associated protein
MSRYDAYAPQSPVLSTQKGWIISALTGSLVVHAGLFLWLHWQKVEIFDAPILPPTPPEVIQRIRLIEPPAQKPVEMKTTLEDKKTTKKHELVLPAETPKIEEINISPRHKPLDTSKLFASEKPTVEMAKLAPSKITTDDLLPRLPDEMFNGATGPKVIARPVSERGPEGDGTAKAIQTAGQDIDTILSGLGAGTGPRRLMVAGNLTFGYNSADVTDDKEFEKTAEVFRKFLGENLTKATFIIEGHTDPTGTPEYNMKLSERRAETVRAWFITHLGLDPTKVQTKGYGATRPCEGVPLTGTVEELQGHRRTEIIVRPPKP